MVDMGFAMELVGAISWIVWIRLHTQYVLISNTCMQIRQSDANVSTFVLYQKHLTDRIYDKKS